MTDDVDGHDRPPPTIDTTVRHWARIWNYWLGGKGNYPVDRQAGDQTLAVLPEIADIARASRHFLARVVRFLAADAGIRQFLDTGTGLPTVDNTHKVAQRIAPESRIVYVDNDPLVGRFMGAAGRAVAGMLVTGLAVSGCGLGGGSAAPRHSASARQPGYAEPAASIAAYAGAAATRGRSAGRLHRPAA